jgi:isocitrate dehydrogenase
VTTKTPITVAHGDGIGPEIMAATLHVMQEAGAALEIETIEIGESIYKKGHTAGILPESWDSLLRTKVFLKAPITTPQGGGFKSLNVTVRKMLGLYANVRPCVAYDPFVKTKHPGMNVVIVRENEEDTYAGIEHRHTDDVYQCLKLISRPGSEKIVRYAFEYARANRRKKVTCFSKDNIMKATDGLFHKVFDEVGQEYPDLEKEFWIVDIGAAKMAETPEAFDVIVMPNLYGDILSDVAAQIAGSVGLAGSSNIGEKAAMFEAIHGSAPRRAGQNLANPSGLLLAGVMLLVHVGQIDAAERMHNAWLRTVEDGIHTYDICKEGVSKQKVGTKEFAQAIAARLGQRPEKLKAVTYDPSPIDPAKLGFRPKPNAVRANVGVDVFLHYHGQDPNELGAALEKLNGDGLSLNMIDNRGVTVYPKGIPSSSYVDFWRIRYLSETGKAAVTPKQVLALLHRVTDAGFEYVKTENLYTFDGEIGFSLGQGQ